MEKKVVNQSNIRRSNPIAMLKKNAMLIILVLVYIFFTIMTKGRMFKPTSFASLINQNAYVYILGCGMLMCMLTGGNIDLSCGAFVCLLGALGGMMMVVWKWGTALSLVAMLAVGVIYGCGLGALIAYVMVPPWIATLAGYLAFRGLGTSILGVSSTNSISFKDSPDFLSIFSGTLFKSPEGQLNMPCLIVGIVAAALVVLLVFKNRATRLRKGYEVDALEMDAAKSILGVFVIMLVMYKLAMAGGIPTVLIWVAAVVLIYAFITSKTTIGRHFYVVGGNIEAARLSGVNTKRIMFLAYLNMAILTSISAMTRQELRDGRHLRLRGGRCLRQRRRGHRAGHGHRRNADRRHQPGHVPDQPGCQLPEGRQGLRAAGCRGVRHPVQEARSLT